MAGIEYGTAQRKRIKRWKRHRVYAQKRLTLVVFVMALIWLCAGLTATKGAGLCYLLSVACFLAATKEYKDIRYYKQALKKKGA